MSFSGKRFRRTGGSNLDGFFKDAPEQFRKVLTSNAPTWCYTVLDKQTIQLDVQTDDFSMNQEFTLGVEHELTRVDGAKVYMTVTLEGDNVVKQKFRKANGTIAYFRREFYDRTATMTITLEGEDVRKAHVFFEVVD